jgi:hypothetical protein
MNAQPAIVEPHQPRHTNTRRFDRGSWLALAVAVAYIAGAIVYVLLAFGQPADGWLYSSGLSTSMEERCDRII